MLNVYEDRESRRFTILEGISKDLSYSEIAEQLGVKKWVVSSDVRKMQHEKDLELRQMYEKRKELIKANRQMIAQNQEKRFFGMTGMTIDEKMFENMTHYYKPDLKRAMGSPNESKMISKLSRKVRKILTRNKIINHGYGKYEITEKARNFLTKADS